MTCDLSHDCRPCAHGAHHDCQRIVRCPNDHAERVCSCRCVAGRGAS